MEMAAQNDLHPPFEIFILIHSIEQLL